MALLRSVNFFVAVVVILSKQIILFTFVTAGNKKAGERDMERNC